MKFAETIKRDLRNTYTENGAFAKNTTNSKCLDLFSTIGALRDADNARIERLFEEAYRENPLNAMKILFYSRDIRGGSKIGERRVFRVLIKYIAVYHPKALIKNIKYIGYYGRWDDLYTLIDTPLEREMWCVMKTQFEEDLANMKEGKNVSLLAKWLKTADASSSKTRRMGINTALKLGYNVYEYKRKVRALRKYIDIVERKMSTQKWDEINYSNVPSRAMLNYRNAFIRHDEKRFNEFTNNAVIGKEKVNSNTLYPYDIIKKIGIPGIDRNFNNENEKKLLEAQWRQLPNYVGKEVNAIVIADTSGSMIGRPIYTSLGLAIYFAQRNKGAFHNLWMSFSNRPNFHEIKGETLEQIIENINMSDWGMNTNLEASFELILHTALEHNCSQEEMPKSIIVISDMEIDFCNNQKEWTFYEEMKHRFASYGYEIPNVIFWNVASRNDVFHADSNRKGVQLVSGQSVGTFSLVMNTVGMTPIECMLKAINDDRYSLITI